MWNSTELKPNKTYHPFFSFSKSLIKSNFQRNVQFRLCFLLFQIYIYIFFIIISLREFLYFNPECRFRINLVIFLPRYSEHFTKSLLSYIRRGRKEGRSPISLEEGRIVIKKRQERPNYELIHHEFVSRKFSSSRPKNSANLRILQKRLINIP